MRAGRRTGGSGRGTLAGAAFFAAGFGSAFAVAFFAVDLAVFFVVDRAAVLPAGARPGAGVFFVAPAVFLAAAEVFFFAPVPPDFLRPLREVTSATGASAASSPVSGSSPRASFAARTLLSRAAIRSMTLPPEPSAGAAPGSGRRPSRR